MSEQLYHCVDGHFRYRHLSSPRHFPDAFLMDMYNSHLRRGHISAAEPRLDFNWVIFMCPAPSEEDVGLGMFDWRDDIHILPMFGFQTVRESKEAVEVGCQL